MSLGIDTARTERIIDPSGLPDEVVPPILKWYYLEHVERLMTGRSVPDAPRQKADYSLAGQLAKLGIDRSRAVPDAVAFTLDSAVPVADAVRGIYAAAGIKTPLLIGVQTNKYFRADASFPKNREAEIARIRRLLDGRGTVVAVDQYVHRGHTLEFATDILQAAGAATTEVIMGRWYRDAHSITLDLEHLTSPLATQMQAIGYACFQRYMTYKGA
jgi:hypothetical protein